MKKIIFDKAKEAVCFAVSMSGGCAGKGCDQCEIMRGNIAFSRWLLDEAKKFEIKKNEVEKNGNFIEPGKECFD